MAATLEDRGYFVDSLRAEAPAGDSVEIVSRVRGARGRRGGLLVRASARFVEAARLAQLPRGRRRISWTAMTRCAGWLPRMG